MSQVDPRGITNEAGEIEKGGCVVMDGEGRFLLVTNQKEPGVWGLPKGHIEPGEAFEAAAVREVYEETGYRVKTVKVLPDLTYVHGGTGQPIRLHLWLARVASGNGVPEDVDETANWVDIDELKRRVFANVSEYFDRNQKLLVID